MSHERASNYLAGAARVPDAVRDAGLPLTDEAWEASAPTPEVELLLVQAELARRNLDVSKVLSEISDEDAIRRVLGEDEIARKYAAYVGRPLEFIEEVLKVTLWSKQREVVLDIFNGNRVSVAAGRGVGKSFLAACTILAFVYTTPGSYVITTSASFRQVKELIWAELRYLFARAGLEGQCDLTKLKLGEKWGALGMSTADANRLSGFHGANLLLIVDEAAGVKNELFEYAKGILTSRRSRMLLLSNPVVLSGFFYDTHHSLRGRWKTYNISVLDTPNFTGEEVPEAVADALPSTEWVDEMRDDWGEDGILYKSQVLGQFPDQTDEAFIALSWILAASKRFVTEDLEETPWGPADEVELGVDIARKGGDECVIYARRGKMILGFDAWTGWKLNESTGRIVQAIRRWKARVVRIDAIGMGAGVADALEEMGYPVERIIVSEAARDPARFGMLRDEIWANLRELLREGVIGGLVDSRTQSQLTTIRHKPNSRGKTSVSTKDDLRAMGVRSPDRADALCLAFWKDEGFVGNPVFAGNRPLLERFNVIRDRDRLGVNRASVPRNHLQRASASASEFDARNDWIGNPNARHYR